MSIVLLDSTSSSLTVSWTEIANAKRYILQYRQPTSDTFETLSAKLTSTQARKRNLQDEQGNGFSFRVGAITTTSSDDANEEESIKEWIGHAKPFHLLSKNEEEEYQMRAPKVVLAGSNQAVIVSWSGASTATTKYELQMRENQGGTPWNTIASSLSGTEVRKKNLISKLGYQFRVRQSDGTTEKPKPFSSPSDPIVALGLSPGIKRWFSSLDNGQFVTSTANKLSLEDALGGKEFVLLYASAHWCGPCRQFTPQLANWYKGAKNRGIEVIFLSADHDENGFESYFKTMPWIAIDYDDDTRESVMAQIRVTGIPRLVVLDGRTGRVVEDNAVGKPLDINQWRQKVKSMGTK
mmetsp:Transcript_23837/g.36845  ORF Transcript_23837/g.36845 Transcript_23837/m.36845 type:complete len:351 (-) Transcript_23837:1601-2653(-)